MELTAHIDNYCERTGPEFWSAPLNALTNGGFVLAGLWVLLLASLPRPLDGPVRFLGSMMVVIGVGSFLFHSFATRWAALFDTGPILIFILGYFAIAMNRFIGVRWWLALLATVGFLLAMAGLSALLNPLLAPLIGGSVGYLPALIGLVAVGLWLFLRGQGQAARGLITAAALFAVSLSFRALDGPLCAHWPSGTHFLWHLLNALVLLTLTMTVARHGPAAMNTVVPARPRR